MKIKVTVELERPANPGEWDAVYVQVLELAYHDGEHPVLDPLQNFVKRIVETVNKVGDTKS